MYGSFASRLQSAARLAESAIRTPPWGFCDTFMGQAITPFRGGSKRYGGIPVSSSMHDPKPLTKRGFPSLLRPDSSDFPVQKDQAHASLPHPYLRRASRRRFGVRGAGLGLGPQEARPRQPGLQRPARPLRPEPK